MCHVPTWAHTLSLNLYRDTRQNYATNGNLEHVQSCTSKAPTIVDAALEAAPKLSTLGKYSLIASLGQGGMAKVYLALMAGPAGFNKLLVVKALREDMLSQSEEFVHMFLDEARLAARL